MSTTTTTLTRESPFSRRLLAYLNERFPPIGYGVLIVSYYSSNQFLAQVLTYSRGPMHYNIGSLMGAVTVLCLFFHLRVFDEHKDYEDDSLYYPHRVLQSGVITLRELHVLGMIAIGLELVLSALWQPAGKPAALVSVCFALGFSLLMRKEFFAREWLRRHFLVYATSHMLIMPLFAMVVYSFATGRYAWEAPGWFWLYAFVGFFVTFNWEISRKIRAPNEEIEGVESYTKVFGTYGAAYAVLLIRVIDTGMVSLVGWHLGASLWFYAVLVGLFCVCLLGFFQYRYHTTPRNARRLEHYAGMYIIAFDLTLAIALGHMHGIVFGGFGG